MANSIKGGGSSVQFNHESRRVEEEQVQNTERNLGVPVEQGRALRDQVKQISDLLDQLKSQLTPKQFEHDEHKAEHDYNKDKKLVEKGDINKAHKDEAKQAKHLSNKIGEQKYNDTHHGPGKFFHDLGHGISHVCGGVCHLAGHAAKLGLKIGGTALVAGLAPEALIGGVADSMIAGGFGGMGRDALLDGARGAYGDLGIGDMYRMGMEDPMRMMNTMMDPMSRFMSPMTSGMMSPVNSSDSNMNNLTNNMEKQMENTFKDMTRLEVLKTLLTEMSKIIGMAASTDTAVEGNYQ